MRFTDEMIAEDEKRWHARDVVTELGYCGEYMRDRKNMTNDDIRFYAYIMRKACRMLKKGEEKLEIDRKRVCKGLFAHAYKDCHTCPYWGSGPHNSSECKELARDAYSLLKGQMPPDEFQKNLFEMFSSIWDCEIDHPAFQDTVGELMNAVIQLYKKAVKCDD